LKNGFSFPSLGMCKRGLRHRRALSIVLKTIFLLCFTISLSFAMSTWIRGTLGFFYEHESFEVTQKLCTWDASNDRWIITIKINNRGTKDATFNGLFLNGIEVDNYNQTNPGEGEATTDMLSSQTVTSCETIAIKIYIDGPGGDNGWHALSAGTMLNVKIHSVSGVDYFVLLLAI